MGLMSFIRKQFLDVIEMPELSQDLLIKKYPMEDQEIQYGGKLIVRESQMAIFLNEGQMADVFMRPGTYTLVTQNIPLLTNLKHWDSLFQSPFKSDVYFVNNRVQINNGWGTTQPLTIRDKEFGMVRLRAFGKYTYKISDPKKFFTSISGATDNYSRETLESQLRNIIVSEFSSFLGQSGVPFIDMASNQGLLAEKVKDALQEKFDTYGVSLEDFIIENLNLPEELQKTIDAKISMSIVGDLNQYTKFQVANSIPLAAQNDGGMGGVGAGLGVGAIMAQAMQGAMTQPAQQPQQDDLETKLTKAKSMLDKGLISTEEYSKLKAEILSKFI